MKRERFFWGMFFIVFGIFLILVSFFGIHSLFFGIILVLIGFAILLNSSEDKIEEINWVKGGKVKNE